MAKLPPSYVPHQSRISVQNITDYSTQVGAAAANEEFRRIGVAINALQDKVEDEVVKADEVKQAVKNVAAKLPEYDDTGGNKFAWALTVFDGINPVGPPRVVQGISFDNEAEKGTLSTAWDRYDVAFDMTYASLDPIYSAIGSATNIKLDGHTWVDPHASWRYRVVAAHCWRSIEYNQAENKLQFVNDVDTPTPNQYYGTNAGGARGWHNFSEAGIIAVDKVARLNIRQLYDRSVEAESYVETWNVGAVARVEFDYVLDFQSAITGAALKFEDVYFRGDMFSQETEGIRTYTVFVAAVPGYYYVSAKYMVRIADRINQPIIPDITWLELILYKKPYNTASYSFEAYIGFANESLLFLYSETTSYAYVRSFRYQIEGGCTVWMDAGDRLKLAQHPHEFPDMGIEHIPIWSYVRWDVHHIGEFGYDIETDRTTNWAWR